MRQADASPILDVRNLTTHYPSPVGPVKAVNDVSLSLREGEILGIVGESGCGKSALLLSVMRLVPFPGRIVGGSAFLEGQDLMALDEAAMRNVRGRKIAMVFQDPMTSLNPAHRVGQQIVEAMAVHGIGESGASGGEGAGNNGASASRWRRQRAIELMAQVGIPHPETRFNQYPHEFSGGQQQRIMIAVALACGPRVLLADEPTTSLDVTIQAQVLELMRKINEETGTAIMMVTHDLPLAGDFCHNIAVMYAGRIVEYGSADAVMESPAHPYTRALLASMPEFGRRERLVPVPGEVPDLSRLPSGCAFWPRCALRVDVCMETRPELGEVEPGHLAACHLVASCTACA